MEEDSDSRREAAIASTPSLHPDFKPKNTKITHSQLAKFQVITSISPFILRVLML